MYGTRVSPNQVQPGDKLATKWREHDNGDIQVTTTRDVKKVGFCPGKPENIHLDHECYDNRFSSVIIATK